MSLYNLSGALHKKEGSHVFISSSTWIDWMGDREMGKDVKATHKMSETDTDNEQNPEEENILF